MLNIVYLVLGYVLPVAAIVALLWAIVARARRARGPRRRYIFVPLGCYVLFLVGVTLVEMVRP